MDSLRALFGMPEPRVIGEELTELISHVDFNLNREQANGREKHFPYQRSRCLSQLEST